MNKQFFVSKRNVCVEFLRIFAIITILWQHIVVSFTTNFLLFQLVSLFFFMISGLFIKLDKEVIKKQIKKITL